MGETEVSDSGIFSIPRKLWVALANDQLKRRQRYLGKAFAKPCSTCIEILMCDGPIGVNVCRTINKMIDDGLLAGPKRIKIEKRRAKMLPVSRYCLEAYGLLKPKSAIAPTNNAEG